jgi:hypothetical protein
MAFSVSPSVIVREIDASAVIPAIATPPAAIAGVFRWGPVNEAILVTSEDDLVARFGKPNNDNYETFFTAADFLAYSNALYVVRAHDLEAANSTATSTNFSAKYPGSLGNSLEVSYVTPTDYEEDIAAVGDLFGSITFSSNTITFSADDVVEVDSGNTSIANTFTTATISAIKDSFTNNDILRIGNDTIGYQDLFVSTVANTVVIDGSNSSIEVSFTNKYTLTQLDLSNLKIERKWRFANLFVSGPIVGRVHIIVKEKDRADGAQGTILETYENVSTVDGSKLADGTANYYPTVLENRSAWINASSTIIDASIAATGYQPLTGGVDTTNESNISLGAIASAYDLFADPKELDIAFILQGKAATTMANGLPTHANLANYIVSNVVDKRRDCVAFLSPPKEAVVDLAAPNSKLNAAIAYRNRLQSSSYWFMDSGYKYRYDKYNDVYRWVPLNGDMAGLASRTESWESPAGYKRGVIKNVVKLAFNPNKPQRDLLYGSDINSVISITGQGILLFGDKTGQGFASAFDRINVRRLFITVEKAIATAAEQFLFEFNDEFTRTQFKNLVEPFLRDIQGRRGIIDFRVISDETVNTALVIDQNMFKANIFIKPARSINVIELTFVATRTGVEFDEIVGQIT